MLLWLLLSYYFHDYFPLANIILVSLTEYTRKFCQILVARQNLDGNFLVSNDGLHRPH